MTGCPCVGLCRWLLVLTLTAVCLWQSFNAATVYLNSAEAYSYISDWRESAKNAPAGSLALLGADAKWISPVDRSRLIAISWERAPGHVSLVGASGDFKAFDSILSSRWHSEPTGKRLEDEGFSAVSTNEYVKTWCRKGVMSREMQSSVSPVSRIREVFALIVEMGLVSLVLICIWGWRRVNGFAVCVSLLIAACLGFAALSHPLLAPNGLGVYGGKAKLLFECGGIPESYLKSVGGQVLQPSYPPGLTLLAYLHFLLSGGCGDRLVQLVVVFAMAVLCYVTLSEKYDRRYALPVTLYILMPVAIKMAAGFYAEPFAALSLVLGQVLIWRGQCICGALMMGSAGLFRPEAGIVAFVFVLSSCLRRKSLAVGFAMSAMSVLPTLSWCAISKVFGFGTLQDWDLAVIPDFQQIGCAIVCEAKALLEMVIPVAAMVFVFRHNGCQRVNHFAYDALVPSWILLLMISLACGFYTSSNAGWMMDNTIPRLVWYIMFVPLSAFVIRDKTPRL